MTIGRAKASTSFNVLVGIVWLAIVATYGVRSVLSALIAALLFAVVPQSVLRAPPRTTPTCRPLPFGAGAIRLALRPHGVIPDVSARLRAAARRPPAAGSGPRLEGATGPVSDPLLRAEKISVHFGGIVALAGVDLAVPAAPLTVSRRGPNGAGKTTLFGVLSGLLHPRGGRAVLDDIDVTNASPQRRAQLGLARTFQRLELFTELTVRDQLVVARRIRDRAATGWCCATCVAGLGHALASVRTTRSTPSWRSSGLRGRRRGAGRGWWGSATGRIVELGRALRRRSRAQSCCSTSRRRAWTATRPTRSRRALRVAR